MKISRQEKSTNKHSDTPSVIYDDKTIQLFKYCQELMEDIGKSPKYKEITEHMRQLTSSKYVILNMLNEKDNSFYTIEVAGDRESLKEVMNTHSFNLFGKRWADYLFIENEYKLKDTVYFNSLSEMILKSLPKKTVLNIEDSLQIGQVVAIRGISNEKTIFDFIIMMDKNETFAFEQLAKLYTNIVSTYFSKSNVQSDIDQSKRNYTLALPEVQGTITSEDIALAKKRYENIIEGTNAGTWEWNVQTGETVFNEKWANIIGYTLDEISPTNINTLVQFSHPEDLEGSNEQLQQVFRKEREYYEFEVRMKHKDGHWVWVLDSGKVISWSENGQPLLMFGTHIDISEIKEREQRLLESEEQNKLITSQMEQGLAVHEIICDEAGIPINFRFLSVNQKFEEQTGLKGEDIVGKTVLEIIPNTEKYWIDLYGEVALTGKSKSFENYSSYLNKWFSVTVYCTKPMQFAVISTDITGLKQASKKIFEKTEELDRFFSVNLDLLFISDTEGYFIRVNKSWKELLGYPIDFIEGQNLLSLVHPEDLNETNQMLFKLKIQLPVYNFVNRFKSENGIYKYIEWHFHPYGKVVYGAARDITSRKEMEELLYLEKELFKTTLLSVGDAVISTDNNRKVVVMNNVAEKLTGWNLKEVLGKPIEEVFDLVTESTEQSVSNVFLQENFEELLDEDSYLLIDRNEKEIPVEINVSSIVDKVGTKSGVVVVFRDITERREKEKQVKYLSFHDHLTGLYNRRYMDDSLRRMNTERNLPLTLFVIDVNGLKLTNDAFGHEMGDELIKTVAEILSNSCREDDIICRVGGDEFVIILSSINEEEANAIKLRIIEQMLQVKLHSVVVSVAIGFAVKTNMSQDINEIQREADNDMYRNKLKYGKAMRVQTIDRIVHDINEHFDSEKQHHEAVEILAIRLAKEMGLAEREVKEAELAGKLHDIGKITVPMELFRKKEPLTAEEWELIRRHPVTSYLLLKSVDEYAPIAEIVLHHHERFDGTGYPAGLADEYIPIISRILSVVEAYETMTSGRVYQQPISKVEAIKELRKNAGTQFDPKVVEVFIDKVLKI